MRLIDANALMEYCNNLKDKTIGANDIARFPTAVGWISVKDRLPEIGAKCLVYADGKMTVAKHIAYNDWITGVWFPVPTYWMPLPEPPHTGCSDSCPIEGVDE